MPDLPGLVAVQSGPALAIDGLTVGASGISIATSATSTGNVVPTLPVSPGTTIVATAGQTYAPGGVLQAISAPIVKDINTLSSTSSSSSSATPTTFATSSTITPAPVISSATSSEAFYSTQYTTSGKAALEIFWVEEVVTVTAGTTPTGGVAARDEEVVTLTAGATPTDGVVARDEHAAHAKKHLKHLRQKRGLHGHS